MAGRGRPASLSFWLLGRGWTVDEAAFELEAVLSRRNHISCPGVQNRVSFALSQRGEALPCHCSAGGFFMQEEEEMAQNLTVVFLCHRGDAVSTGLAFLPLYDCPPTAVRASLYDSSSKIG